MPISIKFEVTVTRGEKEAPLSRVLPDQVWKEELIYKFEQFYNSLRGMGDVFWEVK